MNSARHIATLAVVAFAFVSCSTPQPGRTEILVGAAASVQEVVREAADAYMREHPDVSIATTFGGSGTLSLQIANGAPIDVFVAASDEQADSLERHGLLLRGSRRVLAGNSLVVVQRTDKASVHELGDLAAPGIHRVAIGEPGSVPAGRYAVECFKSAGIAEALEGRLVMARDVRQVLTYVETGVVDAGIVYATDAGTSASARVVAEIPSGIHAPVRYPGAVVAATLHRKESLAFLDYLSSEEGRAGFTRFGFTVPPRP